MSYDRARAVKVAPSVALGLALLIGCSAEVTERCSPGSRVVCDCDGGHGERSCLPTRAWDYCDCSALCRPGETRTCSCGGGAMAVEPCGEDRRWGPCACPGSCTEGCIRGSSCVPNNQADACGPRGLACGRCGDGEECVGTRCTPRPAYGLSLFVVRAEVPAINPTSEGCADWDCRAGADAAPDPYVVERSLAVRTITLPNTIEPQWREAVAVGVTPESLAEPLYFRVFDRDGAVFDDDDPIATFAIVFRPEQVRPGQFTLRTAVGSMTATLVLELR